MNSDHNHNRHPFPRPLLVLFVLLAGVSLACGSFAPRPASQPTPWPTPTSRPPTATPTARVQPRDIAAVTPTPELAPTQEPLPTATPAGNVQMGQQARIVARTGLNIRSEPSTAAALAGRFGAGVLVQLIGGPTEADGYLWWQVDDLHGRAGWVAAGDGTDLWVNGEIGEPRPVGRAVRPGDTVAVTVRPGLALAVRYEPSQSSITVRRVVRNTQFEIIGGPVSVDDYRWWKVRRADGLTGWAAEGDSETRWLSPIE
ncbi:MAG: SH3 domain-containing protein [Caldilineales bacterium]|nr:SH3 domain-containing protein [Caldilineales bacterium]